MAEAIAMRGHDVSIHTTTHGLARTSAASLERARAAGVAVSHHRLHAPRLWLTSLPMIRPLRTAIDAADVVHLHSLYLFHDWLTGALCHRLGTPYIVRPHGTLDPYLFRRHRRRKAVMDALFQTRVLRRAAAVHYTSAEEARLAVPHACGRPAMVVPNAVHVDDYARLPPAGAFRQAHPETADRKILLFLGRLNFKKGLDLLATAFGQLARTRPDLHLVVAGPDDGEGPRTRASLARSGALSRTTFTGMLEGTAKLAAFRDSDLFVLPSYSENFGLAVVEAMACALPVVISNRVNIGEEIAAAGAGCVVPPEPGPLVAAIGAFLDDAPAARRAGQNGQALVRDRFDWTDVAVALERMYRDVAEVATINRTPGATRSSTAAGRRAEPAPTRAGGDVPRSAP
jgi:glycosyltransferase involved in cell wall biosynthesis